LGALLSSAGGRVEGEIELLEDGAVCKSRMGIVKVLPLLQGRVDHSNGSFSFEVSVVTAAGAFSLGAGISSLAGAGRRDGSSVAGDCGYIVSCVLRKTTSAVFCIGIGVFVSVVQSVSSFLWKVLSRGSIAVYEGIGKMTRNGRALLL